MEGQCHSPILIPLWVHKFGTCRSGEVPNYDTVNVGALYDVGFVLRLFVFGSLSAFTTNESRNRAVKRDAPRPALIGAGPWLVSASQTERRQDLACVSFRLDVLEHLGDAAISADHEGHA